MQKTVCTVVILLSILALCFSDVSTAFAATATNHKVNKRLLVVLVDFKDRKGKFRAADFDKLLFSTKPRNSIYTGSMRGYYQEVSKGKIDIDGDVTGWYHAPKNHDYYASEREGEDYLIEWVFNEIANDVNFAKYDADHDKIVDGVIIVHQGLDKADVAEQEGDGLIHSMMVEFPGQQVDGVVLSSVCLVPELSEGNNIATIGAFVHEYGHVLGLPDLYDTDDSTEGVGDWDVMSSGNWLGRNQDGDSPTLMSAWSKKQMNWAKVIELNKSAKNIMINNSVVYQIGGKSKEYFLLEHREKGNSSSFDEFVSGSGLGIWHVDEKAKSNDNELKARLLVLEQADGKNDLDAKNNLGDAGDLFTSIKKSFGLKTNPSSHWNNGLVSGIIINNITRIDNQSMSFDLEIKPSKISLLSDKISKRLTSSKAEFSGFISKIGGGLVRNNTAGSLNKFKSKFNNKLGNIAKPFNRKLNNFNKKIGHIDTQITSSVRKIGNGLRSILGL